MAAHKALKARHTHTLTIICGKNGSEFKCARMRNGSESPPLLPLPQNEKENEKPT